MERSMGPAFWIFGLFGALQDFGAGYLAFALGEGGAEHGNADDDQPHGQEVNLRQAGHEGTAEHEEAHQQG